MKVYRITREDSHKRYYHQPLVKVGTKQMLSATLRSASEYSRYRITKIEEAEVEWHDVTEQYVSDKDDL